ncbi:MAG: toxin TcdB middle/N-terminal domain-containing protein, partial [Chloroflexota bacterium]
MNTKKHTKFQPKWVISLLLWMILTVWLIPMVEASDKSGVSPQVISLPSGPGSLEGIGESFAPDLSTGTASYPVKLAVPPGVAGFAPNLTLAYNGGYPNGPYGLGWRLDIPYIQRQTDEGLPHYDDGQDRFIYSNSEKLVRLNNGDYRFENEGSFLRFRYLSDSSWAVHAPNGIRSVYGVSATAREENRYGIFRWRLERQEDTHGNEIHYAYTQHGGRAYLNEIRYNFSSDERYNAIVFHYTDRPDVFTNHLSRAPITTALRVVEIEIQALGRLVRRYQLDYTTEPSTGTHSLLTQITQVGQDDVSTLPPTTFAYSRFDPTDYAVVDMQNSPPVGLSNPDVELVDINADSLPDVLHSPASGHHFYLNQGNGHWASTPTHPAQSPGSRLSDATTSMVDITGNGRVELVVKESNRFYYYPGSLDYTWEQESRIDYNITPNFTLNDPNLRWTDLNNDKRTDLIYTTSSHYFIWLAHADDTWSESADVVIPALAVGSPLQFADGRVKLGDMNGDRLQELVFVRDGLLVYYPSNGNGDFEDPITMQNAPAGLDEQASQLLLGDLNNDGLSDLVLSGNGTVRYWLNKGDGSFADEIRLTEMPSRNQADTTVRLADMDGDGASELLYSNATSNLMQYVDFSQGTQPNLLTAIDNGLGRTIHIDYRSSTAFYVDAWAQDDVWSTWLPFPVQVVSAVTVHDANSGDDYRIDYDYRDGYYDGMQKEFRGFAHVNQIERGDATAPTTVTRHRYDTGMAHESRKGLMLEQEVLGEGGGCAGDFAGCYQRIVNTATTRHIQPEGAQQTLAYSFIEQTDTFVHETEADAVHLRQRFDYDDYGNATEMVNFGRVCGEDVTCGDDELFQTTDYIHNVDAWMVNYPMQTRRADINGTIVSEQRFYYDGEDYVGLPLGQVTRGNLTRQTENVGDTSDDRFIPTKRQAFDRYGNVVGIMDANGNRTSLEYDMLVHTYPIVEQVHLAADQHEGGKTLTMIASYHMGLGKITAATDFSGHPHHYAYDAFGRITKIVLAGDTLDLPTQQFTYTLGGPVNAITTAQRERSGESETRQMVTYFDGLGRSLQTRSEAANGQVVIKEAVAFHARQGVAQTFLPFYADTMAYAAPDPALPHTTTSYDAMGRPIRSQNPDGSFSRIDYSPLMQVQYDEEDNRIGSPHFDTPKTLFYDGFGRVISVEEINHVGGVREVYATTYGYDLLGNLTSVVDAQGNTTTSRYDRLSRRLYLDNPDRGEMHYVYDDAGNLVQTTDAKGQVMQYTYDAANRLLTESWDVDGVLTPYVTYHYDDDRSPRYPDAQNTLGQVSYVEDQAGAVYYSYDQRGNTIATARHFTDVINTGEHVDFVTRMAYDASDRLTELTYPDGMVIPYRYDAQGQLAAIESYVSQIDYTAAGQRAAITYANGVTTRYDYDDRLRLHHLHSQNRQGTTLQSLRYTFDTSSNILNIADERPQRIAENDQSQHYVYDNLYRLTQAAGVYGQIDYGYDSIHNMVSKQSTASDSRLNLGVLGYGAGTAGPHALSSAAGATYTYDANGNRISMINTSMDSTSNQTTYAWNPHNQLMATTSTSVEDALDDGGDSDEMQTHYVYDAAGQRVRQSITVSNVTTTTLYIGQYAEVRGDELVQYIFADNGRIAEVRQPFDAATLIPGLSGDTTNDRDTATITETRWYLADHLGGTSLLLDDTGEMIAETVYYPYGLTRYEYNGDSVVYRYTGKELDETGLYYVGARYYDPGVGIWLSTDPILTSYFPTDDKDNEKQELPGMGGVFNASNLNVYHYAGLNPLRYKDPTGQ